MKRITIKQLIPTILLLLMLVSCNNNDDSNSFGNFNNALQEKSSIIELTLATFSANRDLIDAVSTFNSQNNNYHIVIKDYSKYGTEDNFTAGLELLYTEIISGNTPDIIGDIQNMPYNLFAQKSLFTNLYPFIDADPDLSRNDFVQQALKAAEIDKELYQIFPTFYVQSLAATSAVGSVSGWTINEFLSFLLEHPEYDIPLGAWITKTEFLNKVLLSDIDTYIDWETLCANFNSSDFIQLLEVSNRFRSDNLHSDMLISIEDSFAAGRQILIDTILDDFNLFQVRYYMGFLEDVTLVGYPSNFRRGNIIGTYESFAIFERSPNKEAAWSFIRTLLFEDWQLNRLSAYGYPTNQNAFNKMIIKTLERDYNGLYINDTYVAPPSKEELQADINKIVTAINSSTIGFNNIDYTLMDIIIEDASDYFNGRISVNEAAQSIQDRVSLYLSELY